MRTSTPPAILMTAILFTTTSYDSEGFVDSQIVESRITSVGLFKNGLAVVRREVRLTADGTHEIAGVPEPVHGTFWIESDVQIEILVTSREIDVPLSDAPTSDLQNDLAGKNVTINFRENTVPALQGRVVKTHTPRGSDAWSRAFEAPSRNYWGWWGGTPLQNTAAPYRRFLVLQTEKGHTYVDTSMIAFLRVDDQASTVSRRRPVLLVTASGMGVKPATVTITYLAKGMAWAPSYRVDISDASMLELEQKAVVKNELEDLEDVEVQLISGFPSVEFSHVLSPLSPRTSWANFFRQLNRRVGNQNHIITQNVASYGGSSNTGGVDTSITPEGEGVDLHYHSIGKRSLLEGESLMLSVASGRTAYERVVEWIVPDTRDANGRYIDDWRRQQNPEQYEDVAWDAVRFSNPLSFPMTTGPAMIVSNGRFSGQGTTPWVNRGEETTLHITKALSIRTSSTEQEVPEERTIVRIGGRQYRNPIVKGSLLVCNHRNEQINVVIRRRFSGDLISTDGSPQKVLREEGVYSVNPRHELMWSIKLDPGEERTLEYRYSVLVLH